MNSIYQHYIIDLSSDNNFVQVPAVQGDGGGVRGFEVELIQNGLPYPIDKNDTFIFIMGTKPDTRQIMNNCALAENGCILVDITSQMSAVKGRGDYQIVLMSRSTNSQLKSFPFYIITTASAFDMGYIASSDEFQALARNITRTEEVIDEANLAVSDVRALEASVEKTEEARVSAESVRASNENTRKSDENTRQSNEAARQTNESDRQANESVRQANESVRQANESDRQASESVRQANTSAAITNTDKATDRANQAAAACQSIIDSGIVVEADKGVAGGVASLDSNGKVPESQLPDIDPAQLKLQMGLNNVDNTPDSGKPVSAGVQAALDALYQQLAGYTDQEIAGLIGGAPSTLDTLGKLAQAMQSNGSVVTALDEALGKKASAAEFDSHVKDKANPHAVTKAQLGLGNVDNTADASKSVNYAGSAGNADTVDGKHASELLNYNNLSNRPSIPAAVAVKGNAESSYRTGNVNITPANIGLGNVNNTADANKSVNYANSAGYASSAGSVAYGNVTGRPTFSLSGSTLTINF